MNSISCRLDAIENQCNMYTNNATTFNLSKKFFLEVFKVIKTASTDGSSRPKMQKVYFNCKNNLLEIVACDGKVLAKLDKKFQFNVKDFNFLIKCSDIYDILNIIKHDDDSSIVNFSINNGLLYVNTYNAEIHKHIIQEEKYVFYNKIIPNSDKIKISLIVDKSKFFKTIENLNTKYVDVKYKDSNNCIIEYPMGFNVIPKIYGNIPTNFKIRIDIDNIKRILKLFNDNFVCLNIVKPDYPVLVNSLNIDNFCCLIMPDIIRN